MTPTTRSDLAKNPGGMRIFEGRYFNINRRFLMCLGLWPYDVRIKKYVLRAIFICILMLGNFDQLNSLYLHYEDIDRLMLGTLCFCVISIMNLKMLAMIVAEGNMISLYRSIALNWQRIQDYRERNILHKYSERARNAVICYSTISITSGFIIGALPLIPNILDFIRPLESARPKIYLTAGEIPSIDRETHFVLYFFLEYIVIMMIGIAAVSVDTMYIATVEHCCALYAIIRSRLLELRPILQKSSPETEDIDSYEWLRSTIEIHQDALKFSSLLNDSYSILFLFMTLSALFIIPFTSCAIIANLDKPLHLMPYALLLVDVLLHGFFIVYPGQRIIDHQLNLLDAAYCNEWYTVPLRTRKLLLIFMLRCSEPVIITAGDLLPVNLQVYFMIVKTSASYITVASSFR